MALTDQTTDKESMILCGGAFGIFATISAMCNRSVQKQKQVFNLDFCQSGLSWSPVLEEILPDPLAVFLPDGAGDRHHLLPAGALLS